MTDVYQFGASPSFAAPAGTGAPYYISSEGAGAGVASGSTLSTLGLFGAASGAMLAAVGSYYEAKSQQYQLKSQASALEFQGTMSRLNATRAENEAVAIMEAGKQEKAALTLQQGQERAAAQVSQAASGTAPGGSNAEVLASQRLIQQIDALTLDSNTVRAANAARTRGVNARNESLLLRTSAANARGSARSISPALAAGTSLLGSTATLSDRWVYRESGRYR